MISAGSDTYGRVKSVDGTPIVTKFVMLSAFPLIPIESFYFAGFGRTEFAGIPALAWVETTKFNGLPLLPFQVTARERAIRRACNDIVGIAADPALLKQTAAEAIERFFSDGDLSPAEGDGQAGAAWQLKRQLVDARLQIALGCPREPLERQADQLLAALDEQSHIR